MPPEEKIPIGTDEMVKEEPIEPEQTEEDDETQPLDISSRSRSLGIVEDRKEDKQKRNHAPVRTFFSDMYSEN